MSTKIKDELMKKITNFFEKPFTSIKSFEVRQRTILKS